LVRLEKEPAKASSTMTALDRAIDEKPVDDKDVDAKDILEGRK
jgi:hypothetical protein